MGAAKFPLPTPRGTLSSCPEKVIIPCSIFDRNKSIQSRQQGLLPEARAADRVLDAIGTAPFSKPDFRGSTFEPYKRLASSLR
jgi:hypothetical protein